MSAGNIRNGIIMAGFAALAASAPAAAVAWEPMTALDAMKNYNLITFDDLTLGSHIEGRVFVGGTMTATQKSDFYSKQGAGTPNLPTLTVVENTNGAFGVNQGGGAWIGGAQNGSAPDLNGVQTFKIGGTGNKPQNLNGSTFLTGVSNPLSANHDASFATNLAAQKSTFESQFGALSTQLGGLADTGVSIAKTNDYTNRVWSISTTGSGLHVLNIDADDIEEFKTLNFNVQGTLVINVAGTSLTLNESFGTIGAGANVLWNFKDATSLSFTKQFEGSVLATKATGSMTGATIDGFALFHTLVQGSNQIHLPVDNVPLAFTGILPPPPSGAVPEPASWAMMIVGFGLIGSSLRRRPSALSA